MSRRAIALVSLLSTSCSGTKCPEGSVLLPDGLCHLIVETPEESQADDVDALEEDSGAPADTGDAPEGLDCPPLPEGVLAGLAVVHEESVETDVFMEYQDVAMLGDGRALLVANNGWSIVDVDTLAFHHVEWTEFRATFRVAADPSAGLAYLATQMNWVQVVDVSVDPPRSLRNLQPWSGWHGDLSANNGRVLVAAFDDGAWLLDGSEGTTLAQLDTHATAVHLSGDRAWVAGAERVSLWDVSEPSSPTLLADAALPVPAVDAAGSGDRVVLALGAAGVVGVSFDGIDLSLSPTFDTDGAAYGVATDGDQIWAATWRGVAMGRWTAEMPEWLGEADSPMFSLGVAAQDGVAVGADWQRVSRYRGDATLSGPELRMGRSIHLPAGTEPDTTVSVWVENAAQGTLTLTWPDEASTERVELCPGDGEAVTLAVGTLPRAVAFSSNDHDEPSGELSLQLASSGLGTTHVDLTLDAIQADVPGSTPWSLADHAGELVYIAWFAPT